MTAQLGRIGVWASGALLNPELAQELERIGYGAIWIGGSPPAELELAEQLLAATDHIVVATGIVNIWTADPHVLAASHHRLRERFPDRFVLGIGAGHPEAIAEYTRPYQALVDYLDVLDAEGVPAGERVLAALGPKVLQLAADRTAGAHPYLTTAEHTRRARAQLGPGVLLAPEQKVVVDPDVAAGRALGRRAVANPYLGLRNYVSNLLRLGWGEADVAGEGSDALIDALVGLGDAEQAARPVREHLDAGADHVAIQLLTPRGADPLPGYRALAETLGV